MLRWLFIKGRKGKELAVAVVPGMVRQVVGGQKAQRRVQGTKRVCYLREGKCLCSVEYPKEVLTIHLRKNTQ
jgi:hypothetical protein